MTSEEHLAQAKAQLAEGSIQCLLYAALDFRLCVESRLLEYSEFAAQFKRNRNSNWKAKDLSAHVDGTYAMKPSVYTVEITGLGITQPIIVKFIPISKETVTFMGQCDNFLHASGTRQLRDKTTEQAFRDTLTKGIRNMEHALSGAMSGPLVRGPEGHVNMVIDADKHPEVSASIKAGMPVTMRIEITELIDENHGV